MSDSEQEILERFSTPGLRRNMLTRADKKAGLEIEPAAKAEPEAQRAIADDISGQVVSLTNARLIRNGEEAMARYEKTSGEIRMGVLKMVRGIIAAKNIYGSQLAFNKWFVTTEYWNVEKSARAALVELADYPAQELLQFLGETDLASPQEILTALRQKSTSQIVSTIKPPPDDPFFALAPELKLRLSELDGVLVTSSREVARVFFHDNHQQLIRHIMWSIWNDPMQPNYHDEFRQHPDGTVDITSRGLLEALNHWGFEYEETERHREFTHAWIDLVCARMHEIEAKTGVNPVISAFKKFFPDIGMGYVSNGEFHQCCCECDQPLPAGPVLHDELWATIAKHPDAYLCFDCTEKRLGRPLTQADLKICPFNAGWIAFDGADVTAMQFARGRSLLAPGEATS